MMTASSSKKDKIPVLLVDDSPMFLRLLNEVVQQEPRLSVIGSAHTGEEAFTVARELHPKVIVFDRDMQVFSNPYATAYLKTRSPGALLVALALLDEAQTTMEEAAFGVDVILAKSQVSSRLVPVMLEMTRL